jgi:Ca2+:H+ antiporter
MIFGAARFGVTLFNAYGSGTALATITTLAMLSLVFPTFTTRSAGPEYAWSQLIFAATTVFMLCVLFLLTQTVRHRDYFLPIAHKGQSKPTDDNHAAPPSIGSALASFGLLLVALATVIGLAKVESSAIEQMTMAVGFPQPFAGVVIATLVLLPKMLAAVRCAPGPHPDQPEPGLWYVDCQHRAGRPGYCRCFGCQAVRHCYSAAGQLRWCCSRWPSWSAC